MTRPSPAPFPTHAQRHTRATSPARHLPHPAAPVFGKAAA